MYTPADKNRDQGGRASASSMYIRGSHLRTSAQPTSAKSVMQQIADNSIQVRKGLQVATAAGQSKTGTVQRAENKTGMSDTLKSGIESLSGIDMSDTRVHYNSSKPSQLHAHAYAQGTNIHLAPGQEKHLPHEAWHVVQQKQGRVQPTMQHRQVPINDDSRLESEADMMGGKALHASKGIASAQLAQVKIGSETVQRLTGYEVETNIPVFGPHNDAYSGLTDLGQNGFTNAIGYFLAGGLKYGMNYGQHPEGRFHISSDHNELQALHLKVINKLLVLGLLNEGWKHRSLANIEYITPPRDELSPGSIHEHEADIAAVKKHLNSTLGTAKGGSVQAVPAPAHNILTGIPVGDLQNWCTTNGVNWGIIKPDIDELAAAFTNEVYIQETSGVLPEDIPMVYETASKAMLSTESPAKSSRIMADLMTRSNLIGADAYNIDEDLPEGFPKHKKGVVGFLTLISSYVLADNLSFLKFYSESKSTVKNLLPFMSKAKLHEAVGALHEAVRPGFSKENATAWNLFIIGLGGLAKEFNPQYWSEKYEMPLNNDLQKGLVFPNGLDVEMANLLSGKELTTGAAPGRALGLDNPNKEVESVTGQKAIPLEDRYFGQKHKDKLNAENMEKVLSDHFKFAIDMQLSHLPEENNKRANALETIKRQMTATEKVVDMARLIKDKIKAYTEVGDLLKNHNFVTKEDLTDIADWELDLEFALLIDENDISNAPDPEQQLKELDILNGKVHQKLTELREIKNKAFNASKLKDHALTFAGSAEETIKDIEFEFGSALVAFNRKKMNADDLLREEDQKTMQDHINAIEKTRKLYLTAKSTKFSVLTKDSKSGERINAMLLLRSAIIRLTREIKTAEEFYSSKYKKIV